jgi:uncharacterized alpha-E superfamily protein
MQPQSLAARVERLERRVTILEELPARVDALTLQVSQLREEMHVEFSAIRTEIRTGDQEIMNQMRVLYEDMNAKLALIQEGLPTRRPRRSTK